MAVTPARTGIGSGRPGRPVGSVTPDSARLTKARADTQEHIARIKEFTAEKAKTDLLVRKGDLLEKADVIEQFSEFVNVVVNFLSPLADRLGRDCGLEGIAVERIQREVDSVRAELAAMLDDQFGDERPGA